MCRRTNRSRPPTRSAASWSTTWRPTPSGPNRACPGGSPRPGECFCSPAANGSRWWSGKSLCDWDIRGAVAGFTAHGASDPVLFQKKLEKSGQKRRKKKLKESSNVFRSESGCRIGSDLGWNSTLLIKSSTGCFVFFLSAGSGLFTTQRDQLLQRLRSERPRQRTGMS